MINQFKSCNGCYFEHEKTCYWFEIVLGSRPKKIPIDTFEKGCKQYKNINNENPSALINKVIETFDGEILSKKYKPPKYIKNYKKKDYKSRHNYTHRRDAQ
tara:strand:- start:6217 stop:6519 length:303 start_codon:yes stop_codon:yes gene_type:complete